MKLGVHCYRNHPQVIHCQKVFMLSRSMLGLDPDLTILNIQKRAATLAANQN